MQKYRTQPPDRESSNPARPIIRTLLQMDRVRFQLGTGEPRPIAGHVYQRPRNLGRWAKRMAARQAAKDGAR